MRVFQVGNIYPAHLDALLPHLAQVTSVEAAHRILLNEVAHAQLLAPCIQGQHGARLCFPQYERGLELWAKDKGMPGDPSADDILLAMIEDHRAEVFYSINASSHSEAFMRRLPSCVRLKVGWLGSRNVGGGLNLFDDIVSNFPTLNAMHEAQGMRTHYLAPSYETQTDRFLASASARPADVVFAGTYSRHHTRRARLIEAIAQMSGEGTTDIRLHLLSSRFGRLAEKTPLGWVRPFRDMRRPRAVRRLSRAPILGAQMLQQLCQSKIVINMAIDIAGRDRGNMRCFEALSAGALMISDEGDYPEGFEAGKTHLTYGTIDEAMTLLRHSLAEPEASRAIADAGAKMLRERYGKAAQWAQFQALCERMLHAPTRQRSASGGAA